MLVDNMYLNPLASPSSPGVGSEAGLSPGGAGVSMKLRRGGSLHESPHPQLMGPPPSVDSVGSSSTGNTKRKGKGGVDDFEPTFTTIGGKKDFLSKAMTLT